MVKTHKHKGVVRSDTGALRMHPVAQKHKDKKVQNWHNAEVNPDNGMETFIGKKRKEFVPVREPGQIIVKFNKAQLIDMLKNLDRSGAREIGVAVKPV